jgi:hypothetical protein
VGLVAGRFMKSTGRSNCGLSLTRSPHSLWIQKNVVDRPLNQRHSAIGQVSKCPSALQIMAIN